VIGPVNHIGLGTTITKNSFGLLGEEGYQLNVAVGTIVQGQFTQGSQFPFTLIGGTLTVAVLGPQLIVIVPVTLPAQPLISIIPAEILTITISPVACKFLLTILTLAGKTNWKRLNVHPAVGFSYAPTSLNTVVPDTGLACIA
jgi:hypothetical protein